MMTQLQPFLSFNPGYMLDLQKANVQYYIAHHLPVASWAMGTLNRTSRGITLFGERGRTPGKYHTLGDTSITGETVHASVRYRMEQHGNVVGVSHKRTAHYVQYFPLALRKWAYTPLSDPSLGAVWSRVKPVVSLAEETIQDGTAEMDLVNAWPDVRARLKPLGRAPGLNGSLIKWLQSGRSRP